MRYLSVCAGVCAATMAWHSLGWTAAGFSEIDGFPRAVLEQRHGAVAVDWDHRYSAQSNSMAVNVMRWLGERIDQVDGILKERN
jgi:hypothetical protein